MKKKSLPIVCAAFLVITMTIQFIVSYSREKKELVNQIEYKMELAHKDFIFEVYDLVEATENIARFFPEFADNTEELYSLVETVVSRFPDLYCCYVAYVPEYSPKKGQLYAPCAFRKGRDSILTYDFGLHVPYLERDWYIGALESEDNDYWSLPYNDSDHKDPIFTHSRKVFDENGKMVGVAGADCTLEWTKQLLEDIMPYDDAVCQLFSKDGTLIVACGNVEHIDDMIVCKKQLSPTDMCLVICVPKHHISDAITGISLITFSVLLSGILLVGLLLRHIKKEHDAFVRVETASKVMEREMQIASGIQLGMLPNKSEGVKVKGEREDVQVEAKLIPMREVGGDLYDYFRRGEDLFFIIGDVSGKGVPAAMFMSATVNLFRSAVQRIQSPKAIMEDMNHVLSENNPSMMFVTAFIGRLHVPTGELLYCNAAHCKPIHLRFDDLRFTIDTLSIVSNIPLGFDAKFRFVEQGVLLGEGDSIVLYTDGITEARNEKREMLGFERWSKIVESVELRVERSSQVENLLTEVETFIGKAEQTDDITLMTIRKTGTVEPLTLRVENRMDRWPELRAALHDYGLCAGMELRALKKTEVAIEEAVANIVKYSQAEWMELEVRGFVDERISGLEVTLRDNGIAFDPTKHSEVDTEQAMAERQIGGLGIALLRKIADEVHYSRTNEINELTILKNI
ncbi:MAG: SpoIIE family protein phosphatase [Bacteroidaceae bacterium]|nr:SpoIIE family protein phosphatase [Bacteroidaceae bacterium]